MRSSVMLPMIVSNATIALLMMVAVSIICVAIAAWSSRKKLKLGHVYRLTGMTPDMWQVGHPRYDRPSTLVGVLIGMPQGTRQWFVFEIRKAAKEIGVILLPAADLAALGIEDLGPYHTPVP